MREDLYCDRILSTRTPNPRYSTRREFLKKYFIFEETFFSFMPIVNGKITKTILPNSISRYEKTDLNWSAARGIVMRGVPLAIDSPIELYPAWVMNATVLGCAENEISAKSLYYWYSPRISFCGCQVLISTFLGTVTPSTIRQIKWTSGFFLKANTTNHYFKKTLKKNFNWKCGSTLTRTVPEMHSSKRSASLRDLLRFRMIRKLLILQTRWRMNKAKIGVINCRP